MKRPLKDVTIKVVPPNGEYQLIALEWSRVAGTSVYTPYPAPWISLTTCGILVKPSDQSTVPYLETKLKIGWMIEEAGFRSENYVSQGVAEGTLTERPGVYTETFSDEVIDLVHGVRHTITGRRLKTLGVENEKLSYLLPWEPGTGAPTPPYARIDNGIILDCRIETYVEGVLRYQATYGGFRKLEISYDLEGHVEMSSRELVLDPGLNFIDGMMSMTIKWEYQNTADLQNPEPVTGETPNVRILALGLTPLIFRSETYDSALSQRFSNLESLLNERLISLKALVPDDGYFYASQEAVDAFHVCNVNGIAYVKDLQALKELIEPAIKVLRSPMNLKNWVSAFLSWWYGSRLFRQDTEALWRALSQVRKICRHLREYVAYRNALQTRYGTFTEPASADWFTGRARCNSRVVAKPLVPFEDSSLERLSLFLNDMGMRLTLTSLWDMVPLSFVLDWFVNVGDLISQVDYSAECLQMLVREVVLSHKVTGTTETDAFSTYGFEGILTMKVYERFVSQELPAPPYRLEAGNAFLRHWWEGALIFLSMKK